METVMTKDTLKLTADEDRISDILPFERRRAPRRAMSGQVTTLRANGDSVRKFSSLDLQDVSETGLRAMSGESLEVNTSITLLFQPHGPEGGYDATGQVVRCVATGKGYEVGIRFATESVAA